LNIEQLWTETTGNVSHSNNSYSKKKDAKIGRVLSHDPDSLKSTVLVEGSQACTVCPSNKSTRKIKMSTKRWWNDNDWGKRSTGTETSATNTLSTANVTRTDLESNLGPKIKLNLHYIIKKLQIVPHREHTVLPLQNNKRLKLGKRWLFTLAHFAGKIMRFWCSICRYA